MPNITRTAGGRTPQDIANEYASALATCNARERRMPATPEGMAYAARIAELRERLAVCVQPPDAEGQVYTVATEDELNAAEAVLIAVRAELKATVAEFLALDVKSQPAEQTGAPQVVSVLPAPRFAAANGTG